MHETSKSIFHRLHDSRYATRYFVGDGIDIGSGPDPLSQYYEFFPQMKSCRSLAGSRLSRVCCRELWRQPLKPQDNAPGGGPTPKKGPYG